MDNPTNESELEENFVIGDHSPTPLDRENSTSILTPRARVIREMALILVSVAIVGTGVTLCLWDGTPNSAYSDAYEFMKDMDKLILGAILATYLNNSNGD